MKDSFQKRRAKRIHTHIPTDVRSVGQTNKQLPENLAKVYSRVAATEPEEVIYPCTIKDLSTNGAFLVGSVLPLLSRVSFQFRLKNYGQVQALGWVLWHRQDDCVIPNPRGEVSLQKGFGVLFESIPLEARLVIRELAEDAEQQ